MRIIRAIQLHADIVLIFAATRYISACGWLLKKGYIMDPEKDIERESERKKKRKKTMRISMTMCARTCELLYEVIFR